MAGPDKGRFESGEFFAYRRGDLSNLLVPWWHSQQARRQRATLLISRVRAVALVFAVLVPMWIVADMLVFAPEHWRPLADLRLGCGVVLALLAWPWPRRPPTALAVPMVGVLMFVPAVFLALTEGVLGATAYTGFAGTLREIYALLPFAMVAGLSLFPLTMLEALLLTLPLFLSMLTIAAGGAPRVSPTYTGVLWLQGLVLITALVSSLSQLQYMGALVRQASSDGLTGALNRQAGVEMLELFFRLAAMNDTPLALMFVDLDHFKAINDDFGHDEGDNALRALAQRLRECLRKGDTLIRWGGEEFLVLLGNTDIAGARIAVQRIRDHGLGLRPDGGPLTASIGVAERSVDGTGDWPELIELADRRMYVAKARGRGRALLPGGEEIV